MYIFTDALGTCVIYLFFGGESDAIRELFFFLSFFFFYNKFESRPRGSFNLNSIVYAQPNLIL